MVRAVIEGCGGRAVAAAAAAADLSYTASGIRRATGWARGGGMQTQTGCRGYLGGGAGRGQAHGGREWAVGRQLVTETSRLDAGCWRERVVRVF
jgi:hypothetical protein